MVRSLTDGGIGEIGAFVGLGNYQAISGDFLTSLGVTLGLGLLIAAMGMGVGVLLGILLRSAPLGWRRAGIGLLALGLVTYAPASLALAITSSAGEPAANAVVIARIVLTLLPLPIMIGALGAVLTRSAGLLVSLGAVICAAGAAWAAQTDISVLVPSSTPGWFITQSALGAGELGPAAAASVIVGILLAVLGVGVGLALHAVRPRVDLSADTGAAGSGADAGGATLDGATRAPSSWNTRDPKGGPSRSRGQGIIGVLAGLVVVAVSALLAWPWLSQLGVGLEDEVAGSVTWTAAGWRIVELVLTVLVTASAAVGIGYLRAFGPHSLRALLVLTPWFFIGLTPLVTAIYAGWSPDAQSPPYFGFTPHLLTVPLLFALTYIADGIGSAHASGRRIRVGATVGAVVLAVGILALVRSQQVLWEVVFLFAETGRGAVLEVLRIMSQTFYDVVPLAILTPVPLLVLGALILAGAAALVPGITLVASSRNRDPRPHSTGSGM
ncbi:MAG TPA: hypothetical protein VK095_09095 [Beutenbergiaceae bacterium]|nr:hypothetical protein [Beutenbergiaceae bacterium]